MASFARRAASLTRIGLSTSKTPLQLIHSRSLITMALPKLKSGKTQHGPSEPEDPDDIDPQARYKRELEELNYLLCDLIRYGLVFYVGFKLGKCGKGKKEEVLAKASTKA